MVLEQAEPLLAGVAHAAGKPWPWWCWLWASASLPRAAWAAALRGRLGELTLSLENT